LELKSKAVISALIEVDIPPDKIPNGRADFGRLYISFDIHAHGASGFAPYKDRISFAFLSIDTEFLSNSEKIKNFNRFVKEVEGIDVKKYELKVQTAFYKPIGLKHGSVYLIGDAGGFSTFLAEGIYAAAKTGKLAAEDICGIDISRENKEFMKWKRRWDFPINLINRYNRVLPKKIRKKISGFIIDILIPKLAKNGFFMSTIFPFAYPKVLRMGWGPLRGDKE
jgi:flavin-dependent dehydrogenase